MFTFPLNKKSVNKNWVTHICCLQIQTADLSTVRSDMTSPVAQHRQRCNTILQENTMFHKFVHYISGRVCPSHSSLNTRHLCFLFNDTL
jgi:hypothetical protein